MKSMLLYFFFALLFLPCSAQSISGKIQEAVKVLEEDEQMKFASLGFYVMDQKTGKVIFNKNGQKGMVPASVQKIITGSAAFKLLGSDYTYESELSYDGTIQDGVLNGNLYVVGSGDPTLGSDRFSNTKDEIVLNKWINSIKNKKIKQINGDVICFDKTWKTQSIPGGWIYDDIGNYFGAAAMPVNWNENAYNIFLRSGNKEGDPVSIISILPKPAGVTYTNELITGKAGSGDNAWIYLPPYGNHAFIRGTIPPGQNAFKISGSLPDPAVHLRSIIINELNQNGIKVLEAAPTKETPGILSHLHAHRSPSLDSIVYWFFRKSINLYGEALVKTIGFIKRNEGSTEVGIKVIKNTFKEINIDPDALNMNDGSGLSPLNRITCDALVNVLEDARRSSWYKHFYNALPTFNGIKMKSGTMSGIKSFAGYINGYSFAIIINNYNGSSSEITKKMYKVLDTLK